MRTFKYLGALILVLAFSMIGVASASAAEVLWPFLPGSVGETFTGQLDEGEGILQEDSGGAFKCKKLEITASLLEEGSVNKKDATLSLGLLNFKECSALGLEVHSEGDANGVILAHVEIHNCLVTWLGTAKLDGVLILPLETKLFIGATLFTTILDKKAEGVKPATALVAPIKKIGVSHYLIDAKQKSGLQELQECEGAAIKAHLMTLLPKATEEKEAAEEIKALIKFSKKIDVEEVLS